MYQVFVTHGEPLNEVIYIYNTSEKCCKTSLLVIMEISGVIDENERFACGK